MIIIIGSIIIYYNYDSISTFLVTSGLMNYFYDYPDQPQAPDANNIDLKDIRNNNDKTPLIIHRDNVWLDHKPEGSQFKTYFHEPNSPTGSESSSGSSSTIGKGYAPSARKGKA
jgi:hypothetical protein